MRLLDLPTDISITILRDWVARFKPLSALDVAVGHAHSEEWLALTRDPIFALPNTPRLKSAESAIAYVQWINTRQVKVESLIIPVEHIGPFTKMSGIALRRATSLYLDNPYSSDASSDHIRALLLLLPSLTAVDLVGIGKTIERLVLSNLNNMSHLQLKDVYFEGGETWCDSIALTIETFRRTLQMLELGVVGAAMLKLICEKCRNLQSLELFFSENISGQIIKDCLASDCLPLLAKLTIHVFHALLTDEVVLAIFFKHPHLTHFRSDDEKTLSITTCASALESCPNLVSYRTGAVNFFWCPTEQHNRLDTRLEDLANESQLAVELPKIGRLRRVGGMSCVDLSNATVLSIAAKFPQLTCALLNLRDDVSDNTIDTLAASCKLLKKLTLTGCKRPFDRSLKAIANHCVHLTNISVGGLQITDAGLRYFLKQRGSILLEVRLPHCTLLTGLSLSYLVDFCPQLTELNISHTNLTEANVMKAIIVPNAFPKLKRLFTNAQLLYSLQSKTEVANTRWSGLFS